jgi:hypothetical protein
LRIALLTNPHDEMSGAFLSNLSPSFLSRNEMVVYLVRMKHIEFSLKKKVFYFLKYVGPVRYARYSLVQHKSPFSVNNVANRMGIRLQEIRVQDLAYHMERGHYDCATVISLGHILSENVLSTTHFYNFHPGSLMDNRGPSPLFWNLYFKEEFLTVCMHKMTTRIDLGEVVAEKTVKRDFLNERKLHIQAGGLAAMIFNENYHRLPGLSGSLVTNGRYRRRPTLLHRCILALKILGHRLRHTQI